MVLTLLGPLAVGCDEDRGVSVLILAGHHLDKIVETRWFAAHQSSARW